MAEVTAPIAATIKEILFSIGDRVQEDTVVMLIEAMKVEYPVFAECQGNVSQIKAAVGDEVAVDQVLMNVE